MIKEMTFEEYITICGTEISIICIIDNGNKRMFTNVLSAKLDLNRLTNMDLQNIITNVQRKRILCATETIE